jgi:hypothetical protein
MWCIDSIRKKGYLKHTECRVSTNQHPTTDRLAMVSEKLVFWDSSSYGCDMANLFQDSTDYFSIAWPCV